MAKIAKTLQKRRLLKLAAMLQADAKNKTGMRFDIGTVGEVSDWKGKFSKDNPPKLDCGTTACAMGLAGISGAFKKAGLGYKISEGGSNIYNTFNDRLIDFDQAAVKVFGVSKEQATYMFSPNYYPYNKRTGVLGEREAVRRIKRVAAGKKIP